MQRQAVGIDIGSRWVKVVALDATGEGQYVLASCGMFHLGGHLWKDMIGAFQHVSLRLNLTDDSVVVRVVDLPLMPKEEWEKAIPYALKKILPDAVESYTFRYHKLSHFSEENRDFFLVYAVKQQTIEKFLSQMHVLGVGASVDVLAPTASALAMLYEKTYATDSALPVVIMDIGAQHCHFGIVYQGELLFTRDLRAISGDSLTQQIMRDTGMSLDEAEQIKMDVQSNSDPRVQGRVANTISIFISTMAMELQRSIDGFLSKFPQGKVEHIYVFGGVSYLGEVCERLAKAIEIPVSQLDPFTKIHVPKNLEQTLVLKKYFFGTACGLAMGDVRGIR